MRRTAAMEKRLTTMAIVRIVEIGVAIDNVLILNAFKNCYFLNAYKKKITKNIWVERL